VKPLLVLGMGCDPFGCGFQVAIQVFGDSLTDMFGHIAGAGGGDMFEASPLVVGKTHADDIGFEWLEWFHVRLRLR